MALSSEKIREYNKRILLSRMRVLINNSFYGLLLMHMKLSLDESCETAATDGHRIYFGPKFLDEISDSELDFIMMHEILHVALRHCERDGKRNPDAFNIACDIVVNSNILKSNDMNLKSITLKKYGESMHLAPDKKEGYEYTAEEVYELLPKSLKNKNGNSLPSIGDADDEDSNESGDSGGFGLGRAKKRQGKNENNGFSDNHTRWEEVESDSEERDVWINRIVEAAKAVERQNGNNGRGTVPVFAERILKELRNPQIDWKIILSDFIQEEICDYTFSPPDKRYGDSPFFLPDFNGSEYSVSDILFMIDTSGSMSDDMITAAFSEIKGAIDQFDGKLQGLIGFFDAAIIEPVPFNDINDITRVKPIGGGGTDFQIIFEYVNQYMKDNPPKSIIILTDGYAPFPKETLANDIPVLWLLNNEYVNPPWGKVARIKV